MTLLNRLKKIDLMKIVPDKLKEASYLGLILSVIFVLMTIFMIINQLYNLLSTRIESELLIDHLKDDKDMSIYIDLIFPNYPCGLVSLDKMDVVHSHIVDVEENLKKIRIDKNQRIIEKYRNDSTQTIEARVNVITEQVKNNEGCRLQGDFSVKLVPGNFHISFHNYVTEFQLLLQTGVYQPDFSHIVKRLEFGFLDDDIKYKIRRDFDLQTLHTLNGKELLDLNRDLGFPHGIEHKINIVPSRFTYPSKESYEMYQYTAFLYKMVGGNMRVTFDFQIENFFMNYSMIERNYSHFFVQTFAIIGGFYTNEMIYKMFLEDGVMNFAFKRRIGKIE